MVGLGSETHSTRISAAKRGENAQSVGLKLGGSLEAWSLRLRLRDREYPLQTWPDSRLDMFLVCKLGGSETLPTGVSAAEWRLEASTLGPA